MFPFVFLTAFITVLLGILVVFVCIRTVPVRQVLIIRDRVSHSVRATIVGPVLPRSCRSLKMPWLWISHSE